MNMYKVHWTEPYARGFDLVTWESAQGAMLAVLKARPDCEVTDINVLLLKKNEPTPCSHRQLTGDSWEVGFYDTSHGWHQESVHPSDAEAFHRMCALHGQVQE